MNLKNVAIYMGILLVVVTLGLLMQSAVIKFRDSSFVTFSPQSEAYVDELLSNIQVNNFDNVTDKTNLELQEDQFIVGDNESGTSSITDNLANLNFFKGLQARIMNPVRMIFNVPSFLLALFGLPLSPFTIITRILNIIFYLGLITMIIKELK